MPDITAGYTYTDTSGANYTVNHSNLNSLVSGATINTGVITTSNLGDGSVTNAKVSPSAGITFTKLASLTSGTILLGSSGNEVTGTAVSGDVTITNAGVVTIANDAVTTAKVLDANVTTAKLADSTGASDGVTTAKLATGAVTGPKIAMTSDARGDILIRGASNYERLGAGAAGQVLTSGGSGANPAWGNNASPSQTVFTSVTSGATWTNSTNANIIQVTLYGGAGGESGTGQTAGGRGGAVTAFIDVGGISSVTYSIGAGGAGGSGYEAAGAAGEASTFGSYLTANGGTGAYFDNNSGQFIPGSDGSVPTTEPSAVGVTANDARKAGSVVYGVCVTGGATPGNDGNDGAVVVTIIG